MSNNSANNSDRIGNLLVVTAPSGAGKSTLVARLLAEVEGISFSISYTTRAPRGVEQHGREYFFLDVAEFERMRDRDEFLEYALVFNNYYGTHRGTVTEALHAGKDILLDIDVQGAAQIKEKMPQAILIFIMPPSYSALNDRLRNRGLDSTEVIERRLHTAGSEVARYREFDYVIINDDLETASLALSSVVRAERQRPQRYEKKIESILATFKGR